MFNFGFSELLVILCLALIVLGPKRIPEAALRLGKFFRELRHAGQDIRESFEDVISDQNSKKLDSK